MANDSSATSEPARWIKLRASAAERARWQALAASRGMSLSELIRASLGGLRLRTRREAPPVAPGIACRRLLTIPVAAGTGHTVTGSSFMSFVRHRFSPGSALLL